MSILIKNANLLSDEASQKENIYIENEIIKDIGENSDIKADRIIDASNKIVMAGGVDVHTHFSLDLGKFISIDDFYTGTKAASYGGTTSIVDHIAFGDKDSLVSQMLAKYHKMADNHAIIDYSFHGAIQNASYEILDEMEKLYQQGIVSTKIYTTYGGKLDDDSMLKILKKAKETGTVVCVHCENDGMIKELRDQAQKANNLDPIYHAKTRPAEAEAEAINRLIYLSELAGFPKLYIVHTSTKLGIEEIRNARSRGVKNLYCETCTQYLTYSEDKYRQNGNAEAVKYICAPPLRKTSDVKALRQAVADGTVDVIATDHCPFFYESEKLPYKDNFLEAPGGIPGVEERMEVILTEGLKRGLSLKRLSELLSKKPSEIFGLSYKKGSVEIEKDADISIFDKESYKISQENRHSACDYTTYEGFVSDYKLNTVISKGRILLDQDGYYAKEGMGKFIERKFV